MDKDLATELMTRLVALGEPLNETAHVIERIADADEKQRFERGIGEMMVRLWADLQLEVVTQYPELGSRQGH
jgi:hypothetical protein